MVTGVVLLHNYARIVVVHFNFGCISKTTNCPFWFYRNASDYLWRCYSLINYSYENLNYRTTPPPLRVSLDFLYIFMSLQGDVNNIHGNINLRTRGVGKGAGGGGQILYISYVKC